ncbi:hypothetical protein AGMMS50230_18330 [Spirochaetia bacterium]|nr:hypothetical protein AGMMS50230_18330 [Spirochaetia bacterium]
MNKKLFFAVLSLVFWFLGTTNVIAQSKSFRDILNSWIGAHYTETFGKFNGEVRQTQNTITYDSSYKTLEHEPSTGGYSGATRNGDASRNITPGRNVEVWHERWIIFYFDEKGIITTWRTKGVQLD